MKKVLVSMLILLSVGMFGCNDTIVLEKDTVESASFEEVKKETKLIEDFNVEESNIEFHEEFYPRMYIDDKIFGVKLNYANRELEGYCLSEDGVLSEYNYNDSIVECELNGNKWYEYYGVTKEKKKVDGKVVSQYYYVDKIKNKKIKIDGLNELVLKYAGTSNCYKLPGIDNYYVITLYDFYSSGLSGSGTKQKTLIIDIINEKIYKLEEVKDDNKEEFLACLYYDNGINSIMGITLDESVKKIEINKKDIKIEHYKEINLQGYKIQNAYLDINNVGDNKIILPISKNMYNEEPTSAIYNTISGEVTILEDDVQITNILGKNNLVNVMYKDEAYLAQIRDDNTINYIYKISKENYNCVVGYGTINKDGNKIFLVKIVLNDSEENNNGPVYDYSILTLTEK